MRTVHITVRGTQNHPIIKMLTSMFPGATFTYTRRWWQLFGTYDVRIHNLNTVQVNWFQEMVNDFKEEFPRLSLVVY